MRTIGGCGSPFGGRRFFQRTIADPPYQSYRLHSGGLATGRSLGAQSFHLSFRRSLPLGKHPPRKHRRTGTKEHRRTFMFRAHVFPPGAPLRRGGVLLGCFELQVSSTKTMTYPPTPLTLASSLRVDPVGGYLLLKQKTVVAVD